MTIKDEGLSKMASEENVLTIENGVVTACKKDAVSVVIPDGVTEIGEYAFRHCSALKSISLPSTLTKIDDKSFSGCTSLSSVEIPEGVTKIGWFSFAGCLSLSSVTIPKSVAEICYGAFENCKSLSSLVICDGVTEIGEYAFLHCSALKSISLPPTLTKIGKHAFDGCNVVESISSASPLFPFDAKKKRLYDATGKRKKAILTLMAAKEEAKKEKIEKVQKVSASALLDAIVAEHKENASIVSIVRNEKDSYLRMNIGKCGIEILLSDSKLEKWSKTLPSLLDFAASCTDVASLRKYAIENGFEDASRKFLYVRNGVVKIRKNTKPVHLFIGGGATKIRRRAFEKSKTLESVVISPSVSEIGNYAFNLCTNLVSIEIPKTVEKIGKRVFDGCRSLMSISFGGTVAQWKALTDKNENLTVCSPLKSVKCFDGECELPAYMVVKRRGKNINGISLGYGVSKIGEKAFSGLKSIEYIEIPEGITEIGVRAFQNCELENVVMPSTLTKIGESAFEGCKCLTFVDFPVGLKEIGARAFFGCENFSLVWYYGSEKLWNNIKIGEDWCKGTKLKSVKIYGLDNVTIKNGVITSCKKDAVSVVTPINVTKIGRGAFKDCAYLTSISFMPVITEIGNEAFEGCTSLSIISFGGTVEQWKSVDKGADWHKNVPIDVVHCTDGNVKL